MGEIESIQSRMPRGRSKVRNIFEVQLRDVHGYLKVIWFNQPYIKDKVKQGDRLLVHGKVELYNSYFQMNNPKFQVMGKESDDSNTEGVLPLYPLRDGLTQNILRKVIKGAFERFNQHCDDPIPGSLLKELHLVSRLQAFRTLHTPKPEDQAPTDLTIKQENFLLEDNQEEIEFSYLQSKDPDSNWAHAYKRLIFEEFLYHQITMQRVKHKRDQIKGIEHAIPSPHPFSSTDMDLDPKNPKHWSAYFVKNLPYRMTDAQVSVCKEIEKEMSMPKPMSQLLQGDVGSGKTVVSIYAMIIAVSGGYQAAMMVPTEILAQQHANSIRKYTQGIPGLNVVVLSGSASAKERREALELIHTGVAKIVVGTHALFQESVQFANLGLVVIDEQHKFGVHQRSRLLEKGNHPDLLAATATPIPRTLYLTLCSDMDVSVIRSLPPGRPELETHWVPCNKEKDMWNFIDKKIEDGQQIYVVCPLIEPSERNPLLPSIDEAYELLTERYLPKRRIAALHGRHSNEEKEETMRQLNEREIDVVVSTTVIEVGVDLPNATVMVILGADRFGLAQLHQLRGRVGRGTIHSYCFLLTPEKVSTFAEQRMRVMEKTRDGFKIADKDLELRGPGEELGTRQSGHIKFKVADIYRDVELQHLANQEAKKIIRDDFNLQKPQHQLIRYELKMQYDQSVIQRPS
jgi:ATP-dependent DNA helicase RecG